MTTEPHLLSDIAKQHGRQPSPHSRFSHLILSRENYFLIGSHNKLKVFATNLRFNPENQRFFIENGVKLGRRSIDTFSTQARHSGFQKSSGGLWVPPDKIKELRENYEHIRSGLKGDTFSHRIRDVNPEANLFFERATPESHHIVEKSLLEKLGLNFGQLDDGLAPTVLVASELHRRFFTPFGPSERSGSEVSVEALRKDYWEFYNDNKFPELAKISTQILDVAEWNAKLVSK